MFYDLKKLQGSGFAVLLFVFVSALGAQGIGDRSAAVEDQLPLKKVVILTSGLSFYEHQGALTGNSSISLPFRLDAVNDALKTLVINDPSSVNPSIKYQSEQTLIQTLRSLKIDLSDNPGFDVILSKLKGTEIILNIQTSSQTNSFSGRITGIEYRQSSVSGFSVTMEPWLILNTTDGVKTFNLKEISSIKFKDAAIENDLNRALDLIAESRNSFSRNLMINLPAANVRRNVTVSYVIPSPVWKVSYRLDLGASKPLFQGWAIVDNDSDNDWVNVQLSLVAGRPTSFIQNLYPVYYVRRPTLPLAIAGSAEAVEHERAYAQSDQSYPSSGSLSKQSSERMMMEYAMSDDSGISRSRSEEMPRPSPNLAGGVIQTTQGTDAAGQFEFTIKNPVNLDRRMSAMLPLAESQIEAEKIIIYSGSGKYPRLGAEIKNTTGMKLPAGPVTVYDGGVYAGDALLEFWNESEKRLISFGEDLSVTAAMGNTNTRTVSSVNISQGVMTINRTQSYIKTYTFVNSGSLSKQLVVEHPKTGNTNLVSPNAAEQTASLYRFKINLPANRETILTVTEQMPLSERVTFISSRDDTLLSYSTNQEIPANVRQVLARAIELKQAADKSNLTVKELEEQKTRVIADQDRIRRNLEAAGSQTPQGQDYLRRLAAMDSEIDGMTPNIEKARNDAKTARQTYEDYLNNIKL